MAGELIGGLTGMAGGGGLSGFMQGALGANPLVKAMGGIGGAGGGSGPATIPTAAAAMASPNATGGAPLDTSATASGGKPVSVQPVVNATPTQSSFPGAANPADIWSALKAQGFNDAQSAALMGNMKQESEFRPGAVNPGEGAQGLIQWRQGRLSGLQQFAAQTGGSPTDYKTQVAYIKHEMQNSESGPGQKFLAATNVQDANAALKGYIRYGSPPDQGGINTRLSNSEMYAKQFGGSAITAGTPSAAPQAGAPGNVASTQATTPVGGLAGQAKSFLQTLQQNRSSAPALAEAASSGQATTPAIDNTGRKQALLSPAVQLLQQLKQRQQSQTLPQIGAQASTSPVTVMVGGARG